jgi:hypothetical protein
MKPLHNRGRLPDYYFQAVGSGVSPAKIANLFP